MHCCRRGQTAWILMVFPNSVLLGQNLAEILFLLWLAFWTKKLQKHNWKRIPYGIAEKNSKKTQRLTHLWPKARSSFFSEWTVGPDRFCSGPLDILRQNVAAKSSIFCRAWHKTRYFAPFCSGKTCIISTSRTVPYNVS